MDEHFKKLKSAWMKELKSVAAESKDDMGTDH